MASAVGKKQKIMDKLDTVLRWGLYLLVFAVPVSIGATNALSGLLFLLFLVRVGVGRDYNFIEKNLDKSIVVFLLLILVSLIPAYSKYRVLRELVSPVLKYALMYYLVINLITTKKNALKAFGFYWVANIISAGYAIYLHFGTGVDRVAGFTHNPNRLGIIMAMFVLINLGLLLFKSGSRFKFLGGLGIVAGCLGLVTTVSRSSLIGLLLGSFIIGVLKDKKVLIGLLIVVLLSSFILPNYFMDRMERLTDLNSSGIKKRLAMYRAGWKVFKKNPVLGIGLNNVQLIYEQYDFPEFEIIPGQHRNLHNLYLNVAVELGIVGFIGLMAMIFYIFQMAWKNYRQNQNWFNAAVSGILVAEFFHNSVTAAFHATEVMLILVFFIGIMASNNQRSII